MVDDSVLFSDEEIEELHGNFNREIVLHAVNDSEKALQSALDIEKILDEKAFWFLKFLSPAVTIFLGYILVNLNDFITIISQFSQFQNVMVFFGLLLIFGSAGFFILAVLGKKYGRLGRYPDTWVRKGVIDGGEADYITNLIYVLEYMQEAIATSDKSNATKEKLVKRGMIMISIGFIFIMLVPLWIIIEKVISLF